MRDYDECSPKKVEIKDVWYMIEGDTEKTFFESSDSYGFDSENISWECATHLQFESKRWSPYDFSMYPLEIRYGFYQLIDDDPNHELTHRFEFTCDAKPNVDDYSVSMFTDNEWNIEYNKVEFKELRKRAKEVGFSFTDGVFVDDFYLDLGFPEGFGQPTYLSEDVWHHPTVYSVKEMMESIDEIEKEFAEANDNQRS